MPHHHPPPPLSSPIPTLGSQNLGAGAGSGGGWRAWLAAYQLSAPVNRGNPRTGGKCSHRLTTTHGGYDVLGAAQLVVSSTLHTQAAFLPIVPEIGGCERMETLCDIDNGISGRIYVICECFLSLPVWKYVFTTHRKWGMGSIGGWKYSCCNTSLLSRCEQYCIIIT